jgi:methylthioribose-1-phosphate isomerase
VSLDQKRGYVHMTSIQKQSIGEGALQSLRWTGQALDLLDQRLLPEEIVYLTL